MPYESGIAPTGDSRIRMSVPYYIVAIMFIMFDVEILLLYPWAVNLQELGWKGFAIAGIFMIFVAEGLIYAWARGGLSWRHLSTTASARTSSSQD
ncbi:MAG: NADH-quinone oxidoreductase subunit A [Candidatus Sumerlaeota bacterium]|nr:NADH-quinone oxidoreductase subunit A [Candidatus Sumerlaeota bacterium]